MCSSAPVDADLSSHTANADLYDLSRRGHPLLLGLLPMQETYLDAIVAACFSIHVEEPVFMLFLFLKFN